MPATGTFAAEAFASRARMRLPPAHALLPIPFTFSGLLPVFLSYVFFRNSLTFHVDTPSDLSEILFWRVNQFPDKPLGHHLVASTEKYANEMALNWQRQQCRTDAAADGPGNFSMSETEAFGMLHDIGVKTPAAMRQHFLTTHGAKAKGGVWVYSREAVTTFAMKWVCVDTARRDRLAANRRTIGRTTLFRRLQTCFEHLTIGRAVFVQRDSIARLLVP